FFLPISLQPVAQDEAGIRRVADAELADDLLRQTAPGKVLACAGPFGAAKLVLQEQAGALVHVEQDAAKLRIARFGGRVVLLLRQRDAELLRDQANGLRKRDVLDLLHEGEDVARGVAPAAVEELARGVHRKRRRLLVVEGAETGKIL